MHFHTPTLLWLLLVIPPLVAALFALAFKRKEQLRLLYGSDKLVSRYSRPLDRRLHRLRTAAVALGLSLLIAAIARPTIDSGRVEFPQGTTDVVVLVDVSRSMAALDYKGKMPSGTPFSHGTRLDLARYLIMSDVVPALGANRLGIVTFAGEAFPMAFLTQDVSAVDWVHRRAVTINSAPGEGSALVKAFRLAFKLYDLDSDPAHRKVIILFSDGGNDDGLEDLSRVTEELRGRGIDLVVVGLGKLTPSPIPMSELPAEDRWRNSGNEFYQENGETATSQLDENVLRLLANRAGGRYMRMVEASDFSFASIANRLEMRYRRGQQELFLYPLMLALVCLSFGWFLEEELFWLRRKDAALNNEERKR